MRWQATLLAVLLIATACGGGGGDSVWDVVGGNWDRGVNDPEVLAALDKELTGIQTLEELADAKETVHGIFADDYIDVEKRDELVEQLSATERRLTGEPEEEPDSQDPPATTTTTLGTTTTTFGTTTTTLDTTTTTPEDVAKGAAHPDDTTAVSPEFVSLSVAKNELLEAYGGDTAKFLLAWTRPTSITRAELDELVAVASQALPDDTPATTPEDVTEGTAHPDDTATVSPEYVDRRTAGDELLAAYQGDVDQVRMVWGNRDAITRDELDELVAAAYQALPDHTPATTTCRSGRSRDSRLHAS